MTNSVSEMTRVWQQTLKLIDQRLGERQIFDSFLQIHILTMYMETS